MKNLFNIGAYKLVAISMFINLLFWVNYLCYLYITNKINLEVIQNIIVVIKYLLGLALSIAAGGGVGKYLEKKNDKIHIEESRN